MATLQKRALVIGVTGQDGNYLADFLLKKGYEVHGTTRSSGFGSPLAQTKDGLRSCTAVHTLMPANLKDVKCLLADLVPDEIYNLS